MRKVKAKRRIKKPSTLSIDIGGTGLKAAVLDREGRMMSERVKVKTPEPATPKAVLKALRNMVRDLPAFDRISVGFPGVVRDGVIVTAVNLAEEEWKDFNLRRYLKRKWKKPVRILNDADMQGLAAIQGEGVEFVMTLGTGVGTSIFCDGKLQHHLELAHHPLVNGKTYEELLGDQALKKTGKRKWNQKLRFALSVLYETIRYDAVYLGGGNSRLISFKRDKKTRLVSNRAGVLGGIALWEKNH